MREPALSRQQTLALTGTAVLVLAPHMLYLPPVVAALSALFLLWRGVNAWRKVAPPGRIVLLPIAVASIAVVLWSVGNVFGKMPGLALLALFMPLKLLEARNRRDGRAALLLGCFLLMGLFLHEQNMLTAVLALIGTVAVLASFAMLQQARAPSLAGLREIGLLMAQAVPLLVVLFVLFPRIDGPLWGLPLDQTAGRSGLSDTMEPGSISELIMNGEIAFRVEFQGAVPPASQRYWRGPVLTRFDGRRWQPLFTGFESTPAYTPRGPVYDYSITLEPHNQRWLMALDYPVSAEATHLFSYDYTLLSRVPVRNRMRYTLRSQPQAPVEQRLSRYILLAARQLPEGYNPRSLAIGAQWKAESEDPDTRLGNVLDFMRRAGLRYTLTPPVLGQHSADEFLFDTREGFCEHFSSAFVVLARAAGLPARVVTGYQGGEINPLDRTLVVRQSDAHAWAEVWLDDARGWQRVDPTAASYPTRIESGLGQALGDDALPFMLRTNNDWVLAMRHRWEAINNGWNQWVLGYNAQRQAELMRRLGLGSGGWHAMVGLMAMAAGAWMLWIALRLLPRAPRRDALDKLWHRFCARLAARGHPRLAWEPASTYAERVVRNKPELAALRDIAEQYEQLRYGRSAPDQSSLAALRALMRQLGKT
ncbi:transglutaminase TgpA family protein [Uliginosibacterium sp. H1]|uniref:transglutaminase TgpA family protein n=1 Tax=Uliginosibacterium sp. H1 TaxID=3114757 RepID=UPI002E1847F8|nr:DUF3488 and transglutaminase-like domain-containing protein [Uliginosibacterium sp. H1]